MLMIQGEELHVTKTYSRKRGGGDRRTGVQHGFISDDGYMKGEKDGLLRRLFH